jgi:hypothetical protein
LADFHPVPRVAIVPALTPGQARIKRALDVVGAVLGLTLLSPLFALLAIAVKLDSPGPVLFAQMRVGLGGRPFRMFKFRTMRDGADDEKASVADLNRYAHELQSTLCLVCSTSSGEPVESLDRRAHDAVDALLQREQRLVGDVNDSIHRMDEVLDLVRRAVGAAKSAAVPGRDCVRGDVRHDDGTSRYTDARQLAVARSDVAHMPDHQAAPHDVERLVGKR